MYSCDNDCVHTPGDNSVLNQNGIRYVIVGILIIIITVLYCVHESLSSTEVPMLWEFHPVPAQVLPTCVHISNAEFLINPLRCLQEVCLYQEVT